MSGAKGFRAFSVFVLSLIAVGLTTLIVMAVTVTVAQAQTTTSSPAEITTISLSGTATANGEKIPPGASITVFKTAADGSEFECGRFTTESGGSFTLSLNVECRGASELSYRIQGMSAETKTVEEIVDGLANLNIGFTGLSDEELIRLGVKASTIDVQALPLIDQESLQLILMTVVIVSALVLAGLIFASSLSSKEAFEKPTEALVLLAVITAVIILGVTGKIGSDGLISVLAAIVGWTAGRAGGSVRKPVEPTVIYVGPDAPGVQIDPTVSPVEENESGTAPATVNAAESETTEK